MNVMTNFGTGEDTDTRRPAADNDGDGAGAAGGSDATTSPIGMKVYLVDHSLIQQLDLIALRKYGRANRRSELIESVLAEWVRRYNAEASGGSSGVGAAGAVGAVGDGGDAAAAGSRS